MTAGTATRPSREYRATIALLLTGAFTLLVVLLYWQTISSVPAIRAVTLAGPVIGGVVQIVIAFGLAWRHRWAAAVITPALWIVLLSGVLSFIAALAGGGLNVPIGAILAIWALRASPRGTPEPGIRQAVERVLAPGLVAALVVVAAWPLIVPSATQPSGPLIAAATDLHLEIRTATPCPGGVGPAHDPPETIDVVLHWTWARAEPIRAGTDAIVLRWATMGGPEGSGGYYLDEPLPQQSGITEEDRSGRFAVYRNDLAARGFEPGSVTIRLRRPNELTSGAGVVQVGATYAHHYAGLVRATPQGMWTRAEVLTCEW